MFCPIYTKTEFWHDKPMASEVWTNQSSLRNVVTIAFIQQSLHSVLVFPTVVQTTCGLPLHTCCVKPLYLWTHNFSIFMFLLTPSSQVLQIVKCVFCVAECIIVSMHTSCKGSDPQNTDSLHCRTVRVLHLRNKCTVCIGRGNLEISRCMTCRPKLLCMPTPRDQTQDTLVENQCPIKWAIKTA